MKPYLSILMFLALTAANGVQGSDGSASRQSPWLLAPVLSSNPKLGTSAGALGAYVHQFAPEAPPSMFGAMAQYSTTDSYTYGLFARAYLGEDRHRVLGFVGGGKANNDYQDFLGSGREVSVTDDITLGYAAWLYRVSDHWYLGGQGLVNDYAMLGSNEFINIGLGLLGLDGFSSNALGLKAEYDSRDNTEAPNRGIFFTAGNLAYREALGGEESFDVYNASYAQYFAHGAGSVLATHAELRLTDDAPPSGYSSIRMRGYVQGEFRDTHSALVEMEERYFLAERWRLAAFAGVTCLLDSFGDCGDTSNLYAAAGLGVHFVLRPREQMTIRLDFARGEGGSQGLYMAFGQAF
ncbi:hypothetical protein FV139_14565 [Parahaliea maris]|uniref:Bacterial surface antigen (D15) domain-containing protein n=1 Tax=Parahaliea maris TaxID=2716870 RepID=A0A5C8ZU16_9GAMM|nr:hypothetical protein [Parahaliea maris]TXS91946.1 hypothetical protein FV139_14565 [Parahaliea maris]